MQVCSFSSNGKSYAIDILKVSEIIRPLNITPVAHAGKEIKGITNVRGDIKLIVDFNFMVDKKSLPPHDDNRFILFKDTTGENFGILVDRVGEIFEIDEKNLSSYQQDGREDNSAIFDGICTIKNEIFILVNPIKILEKCTLRENQNNVVKV